MILPPSQFGTMIVMIIGLLCAGLWANTFKAGKVRFEIYYLAFAFGLALAAVLIAFTAGNLGFDGFSIMDDLSHSRKLQWMDAFLAGMVFNLGNMFLVAAISVSGMAVAIPLSLGLALAGGAWLGQWGTRASNPMFLYLGIGLIAVAILADAIAHSSAVETRKATLPKAPKGSRRAGAARGLVLAIVSGIVMLGVKPLVHRATIEETALGPYSVMLLLCLGAFASTFMYSLFFINLPVQGHALEITELFNIPFKRHIYGILGGVLCCGGIAATLVGMLTIPEAQVSRAMFLGLSNGGLVIAGICGLAIWKEFADGGGRAKAIGSAALLLFAAGVVVLALAFS
ncbi:MAG TPA: hypothetical protein VKU19_01470 [Bryobacteraceae bacterium]|nr:hypothetical protein [Bryobacteraceae bacterium]